MVVQRQFRSVTVSREGEDPFRTQSRNEAARWPRSYLWHNTKVAGVVVSLLIGPCQGHEWWEEHVCTGVSSRTERR